jgi:predicted esterase
MGGGPADEDIEGMLASIESIQSLVEQEVANGIDREKIVIGGFSQGELHLFALPASSYETLNARSRSRHLPPQEAFCHF